MQGGGEGSLSKEEMSWLRQQMKGNQSQQYAPSYQTQYNPYGGYNRFPANYGYRGNSKLSNPAAVNYNPANTYMQDAEQTLNYGAGDRFFSMFRKTDPATGQKKHTFGPKSITTKVSFRTYRDPQTGEMKQAPATQPGNAGTNFLGMGTTSAPAGYTTPNSWGQGQDTPASDAWINSNLDENGIYKRFGGAYAQNGLRLMDNPDMYPYLTPQAPQYNQPAGEYEDFSTENTLTRRMRPEDKANWIMTGLDAGSALMRNKEYGKIQQKMQKNKLADNAIGVMPANTIGNEGTYNWTGMSTGAFRPNQMTPIQEPGMNYNMQGFATPYQEGGEYELSDQEIMAIMRSGGSVTFLD
jgi:hypothetical protein